MSFEVTAESVGAVAGQQSWKQRVYILYISILSIYLIFVYLIVKKQVNMTKRTVHSNCAVVNY